MDGVSTEMVVALIALSQVLASGMIKATEVLVRRVKGGKGDDNGVIMDTHRIVAQTDSTGNPALYGERLHREFVAHSMDDALYQKKTDLALSDMVSEQRQLRSDIQVLVKGLTEQSASISRLIDRFSDLIEEIRRARLN